MLRKCCLFFHEQHKIKTTQMMILQHFRATLDIKYISLTQKYFIYDDAHFTSCFISLLSKLLRIINFFNFYFFIEIFGNSSIDVFYHPKFKYVTSLFLIWQRYAKWSHDLTAQSEKVRKNLCAGQNFKSRLENIFEAEIGKSGHVAFLLLVSAPA